MPRSRPDDLDFTMPDDIGSTLAGELVPVADELRHLRAEFGAADWRVFLVHIRWTGGQRGMGQAVLVSELEILPAPSVRDYRSRQRLSGGIAPEGDIEIREISLVYTEDQLLGRGTGGSPPDQGAEFFWELRTFGGDSGDRVRCAPAGQPVRDHIGLQWRVRLQSQRPHRARDGQYP